VVTARKWQAEGLPHLPPTMLSSPVGQVCDLPRSILPPEAGRNLDRQGAAALSFGPNSAVVIDVGLIPVNPRRRQRGFVLIAMSVTTLLLLAMIGLCFDFGRIYIARNEAQVFTDSAAMTAAAKLDGTPAGVIRAREAVAHSPMRWNLGTEPFTGVVVEFANETVSGETVWERDPKDASALSLARVTAPANGVDIVFLRGIGGPKSFTVPARSVAAVNPVRLIE
jgi:Flp pilus assembly protein TadG